MGIEPFLVASRDRLRRRPAPGAHALHVRASARTIIPADDAARRTASTSTRRHRGLRARRAARAAAARGYKGRIGLYEVMTRHRGDPRADRSSARSADEIAEVAMRDGMRRLRDDGLEKVRQGSPRSPRSRASPGPASRCRLTARSADREPPRQRHEHMRIRFRRAAARGRRPPGLRPPPHRRGAPDDPRRAGGSTALEDYPVLDARRTRARSSTRSSPTTSASGWRPTGSSTSPTRSPVAPASASTPTSSAPRSAPPSA